MIMPSAARVSDIASSEPVDTCPLDGAPFLASRGCQICVFDVKYDNEPLGFCADCGAGLDGREYACASCMHAALLADARTAVTAWVDGEDYSDTDAASSLAREALAGMDDVDLTDEERGRLLHEALLAEARPQVERWVEGQDAA